MSDDGRPRTVTGTAHIVVPTPTISARIDSWAAFSFPCMNGAAAAALRVREIEQDKNWERDGNEAIEQACIAVVLAATSLEAYANEALFDCMESPAKYPASAIEEFRALWSRRDKTTKQKLGALARASGTTWDFGGRQWRDVEVVLTLRSDLVHYRPSWASQQVYKNDPKSALVAKTLAKAWFNHGDLEYPRGVLHYATCRFAILAVAESMASFGKATGLSAGPTMMKVHDRLPPSFRVSGLSTPGA